MTTDTDAIRSAAAAAGVVPFPGGVRRDDEGPDGGVALPRPRPGGPSDLELAEKELNDVGNADRLIARAGGDFMNIPELGWHRWDGRRWTTKGAVAALRQVAHFTARMVLVEAQAAREASESEATPHVDRSRLRDLASALGGWSAECGESKRITAMIREAEPYLNVPAAALDSDPMVLNLENGTLELSGACDVLRPHERGDLITHLCPVTYDPAADAPVFKAFLHRVQPLAPVRGFLQRWTGYCQTGRTDEQKMVFDFGGGANGKSTFNNLIGRMMGGYTKALPFGSLIKDDRRSGSEATPDIAELPGARFVQVSEPNRGQELDPARLKTMTGGDPLPARQLYKPPFHFLPQFKIVIAGNHKPKISDQDDGIWRRVLLVPWEVQIPVAERDAALPDRLWAERSGVLNWVLDGLRLWLEDGLQVPAEVADATADYRAEGDPVGKFVAAMVVVNPHLDIGAGKLFDAYQEWCKRVGERVWSNKAFGQKMVEMGYERKDRSGGRFYIGIGVREDESPAPSEGDYGG
ncbi:MAG: phage/plasmid primase, P4 family [Minwuia sp.]|nr:phage/plasmid primase, P4 family [Minwuia sp.]